MNILIFSAQFLPHLGGIENFTYNLSKCLIKEGHNPIVVTSNTTNSPSQEVIEGLQIYRFDCINLIDGRFPIHKKNKLFNNIVKILDDIHFDFEIVNARFYFHSIFAVKYATKRNIPHIVIDHGTSHLTVHQPILDYLGGYFEHFLTHFIKKYNKDFYGVSKASSQWLSHFNIHSKGQIYNAIDLNKINEIKTVSFPSFKEKYKVSKNSTVISFTGRLLKEKGILQMVHSILKYNENHEPVYCFIAGDGPLYNELKGMNNKYIVLLGRLPFDQVIHMLCETDIFCLVSDSEGFSTSLLEAAACYNYIVTTARGGAREVILNDDYGLVIENNDEESVYNALEFAIQNKNRKVAAELTYKIVENNFTWEVTTNRIIELVRKSEEHE